MQRVQSADKPTNKANMDEPQEEFIAPQSSSVERDQEHGDELQHATHADRWELVADMEERSHSDRSAA